MVEAKAATKFRSVDFFTLQAIALASRGTKGNEVWIITCSFQGVWSLIYNSSE